MSDLQTWDAVSEVEAYPPEVEYKVTVLGNCGIVHASFEEWRSCESCKRMPGKTVDYAWWRQPWAPTVHFD